MSARDGGPAAAAVPRRAAAPRPAPVGSVDGELPSPLPSPASPGAGPGSGPGSGHPDGDQAEADRCPVCSAPASHEHCPRCGWTLFTGYLLGDVSDADFVAFDQRLALARRGHELGCAALAAGYPDAGDDGALRRLSRLVPGPPATDEDFRAARQLAARLARPQEPAGADGVPGPGVLVELGGWEITRTGWEPDAGLQAGGGRPVEQAAFSAWPWTQLLPARAASADLLAFALASGQGLTEGESAALQAAVAMIAGEVPETETLFIRNQLTGWAVPETLLAEIGAARPTTTLARGASDPGRPAGAARHGPAVVDAPEPVTALTAAIVGERVRVAFGGSSGAVRVLTIGAEDTAEAPDGHRGRVTTLDVDGRGGTVASGGRDGAVLAWDIDGSVRSPRPVRPRVVTRHSGWVNAVRVAVNRVYSLGDDGWLHCAGAHPDGAGRPRFRVDVSWQCSLALAVTGDGGLAAAAGNGGQVRLMNGDTGELVRWIDVGDPVAAMAASDAAGRLAVAAAGGVRVYDLHGGEDDGRRLETGTVGCIDIGPDGVVATGDDAGYVRLFRVAAGRNGRPATVPPVFAGRHQAAVRAVRLLDDGCVVSADADGLIRVWSDDRAHPRKGRS